MDETASTTNTQAGGRCTDCANCAADCQCANCQCTNCSCPTCSH
jgi:hypothetical protein